MVAYGTRSFGNVGMGARLNDRIHMQSSFSHISLPDRIRDGSVMPLLTYGGAVMTGHELARAIVRVFNEFVTTKHVWLEETPEQLSELFIAHYEEVVNAMTGDRQTRREALAYLETHGQVSHLTAEL